MSTPFHAKLWAASLLAKGPSSSLDNLSRSIASARVDLNPHQIDAALFALRSPLSTGVLLADEVGLGKTIEAAIVIAQKWAERNRRILLILPATLRKQWQQELHDKFGLPSYIWETKPFKIQSGNPLDTNAHIAICSYHFAAAHAAEIQAVPWNLVVLDEAHRLRNVYKTSNKMAATLKDAIAGVPKILLTATPLQNSLMELYGLVSIIDDHAFGGLFTFREQFLKPDTGEEYRNLTLRERLKPFCTRTLRRQVLEYVRFTQRIPLTQDFTPTDEEQELYDLVSSYLQRNELLALPASQRSLMTMILRKLLASSSFAIAGTLQGLIQRLQDNKAQEPIQEDFETLDEVAEEWTEEEPPSFDLKAKPEAIDHEIQDLQRYFAIADRIKVNAKGDALLAALQTAFAKAEDLGAARKAVIFTESRRTQRYLFDLLSGQGYKDQIVMIDGVNTDETAKSVYKEWTKRHKGSDALSGSRTADMKAALVEQFRDRASILIATESAAEGVNLQFCSLVINYDLPWNPQRIEQRIGRCHRYGQKHDVVVVNFLNRRNAADQRVFELLSQKLRLFEGVFGASDEVLGALESGVDFEKRIARVYQECRTPSEIQAGFDQLQAELEVQIQSRLAETRRSLLENVDEEVHNRLHMCQQNASLALNRRQDWLKRLAQFELSADATFPEFSNAFQVTTGPHAGTYNLDWREAEANNQHFFRQEHPLASALIQAAADRTLGNGATIKLNYRAYGSRLSIIEPYLGKSGWIEAAKLTITAFEKEEHIVLAAVTEDGFELDEEMCHKLLAIPGRAIDISAPSSHSSLDGPLADLQGRTMAKILHENGIRNARHFDEEVAKLDHWAEDLKLGLEREIKDLDRQIKETRRDGSLAPTLEAKLTYQRTMKSLEGSRNQKRRDLFDAQDEIDRKREDLIQRIEKQMQVSQEIVPLFKVRWTLEG